MLWSTSRTRFITLGGGSVVMVVWSIAPRWTSRTGLVGMPVFADEDEDVGGIAEDVWWLLTSPETDRWSIYAPEACHVSACHIYMFCAQWPLSLASLAIVSRLDG